MREERQRRDEHVLAAVAARHLDDRSVGLGEHRSRHDRPELEQGLDSLETAIAVVVAGQHDHARARRREVEERVIHDLFGFRRWRGGVEDVAAHQYRVDLVCARDVGDLSQDRDVLVGPRSSADRAADVPVGGVQEPHRGIRAFARLRALAALAVSAECRSSPALPSRRSHGHLFIAASLPVGCRAARPRPVRGSPPPRTSAMCA